MRSLFGVSAFLMLAVPLAPAADPPDARKALNRYYSDRLKQPFLRLPDQPEVKVAPPPWVEPLKQLACAGGGITFREPGEPADHFQIFPPGQ